ncbi:hypothetical protein F5884DRAFT_101228 [Xylogone sp. PMI_703]|nr:hypothetical protein F5884DRAFT_101228 [Xylogone sp. PMI_703]
MKYRSFYGVSGSGRVLIFLCLVDAVRRGRKCDYELAYGTYYGPFVSCKKPEFWHLMSDSTLIIFDVLHSVNG